MLVFTLYKDGTAEQDGFEFRVPQGGIDSNTGRVDFIGDVYKSYYDEMVAWLYELFGSDIGLDDCFGSCNIPTIPSDTRTFGYYEQYQAQILSRKTVYKTGTYMNAPFTPDTLDPDAYYYLKGSNPITRRYIKFNFRWDTTTTPSYDYYTKENGQYIRRGGDSGYSLDFAYPYVTAGGSIKDFETFKGSNWNTARQACSEYLVSISTVTIDSEAGQPKIPFIGYGYSSSSLYGWLWDLYQAGDPDDPEEEEDEPEDPYNPNYPPGGEDPGSGDRPPYDEGDDIPIPDLPPFNLADSGFTSLWIPSRTTLGQLAAFLWSDNVIETIIKKLYANPIDVIISLGIVPFDVTPDGSAEICVGTHGTGITSAYVNDDCVIIDCGEVSISEMKPGGYLNFSPYTEAKMFLPFVGFVDIDIDVAMNSELHIEYHVCLTNGSFVVFIESTNQNTHKVIAEFEGNCKITVPITAADYSSMWQAVLGTLTAPLLAAAGGAASGAISAQYIGASSALTSDFAAEGANQGLANSIGQGIGDAGNHITDKLSPNIACSGSFSAGSGMMGNRKPFIVLKSPEVKQPEHYNIYRGYPLQAEKILGSLEGYTEVSNIQLKLPGASGTETGEAERLLRNGFIIGNGTHPQVSADGIALCRNESPINQIKKNVTLISQLNGDFRDSVNMMHPVVRIEKSDPTDFNYVYIGEFKRWYFVNKIDVVRTGILDLHLKEDVLESFADDILAHSAIVANNAAAYNVYLNDKQLITTQRSLYWRKEFPHGFMENNGFEWVMLIAGSRQSS